MTCHASAMTSYLRRLLRTGAAYQLADAVSKVVALALLPVYTRHLTRADYGTAELLLTTIILVSIILRLGLGEAFVRFHYLDADPERRRRLARTATGTLFVVTTLAAGAGRRVPRAGLAAAARHRAAGRDPRRRARPVGVHEPGARLRTAAGGGAGAGVRGRVADQRRADRAPHRCGSSSAATRARSACCSATTSPRRSCWSGLWVKERESLGLVSREQLGPMLRFGLPTVPAEVSVFALFFVDRLWLYRFESPDSAGLYSLSVKLAGIVIFTVRAFQYAWPPLAYSIDDDAEAARVYARITTYYVLFTGLVVAGLALLGRWVVRDLRRARVLRGARGAAVGRARLGALRAVPGAGGDGRACAGDRPQRARRAVRPGGQHRPAGAARAAARDRRRRAGAGRRLRRDARGDVGADPQPVLGRVRVGSSGPVRDRRRAG